MRSIRVLIVDDEQVHRTLVADFLRLMGERLNRQFKIFEADNGMQGIELMRKHKPELVFLDVDMPRVNGLGVLQSIQKLYRRELSAIPIVMTTAHDDKETVESCAQWGARDYLLKPFDLQTFLEKVRSLLRI